MTRQEIFARSSAASAPICRSASSATPKWRRWSTRPTNGSSSAPASASATSRPRARRRRRSATKRRRGRARQRRAHRRPTSTSSSSRPRRPTIPFPPSRRRCRPHLGMTHGVAFDLQAVCSGFVFAVTTADKFLVSGSHKRALVIGAETFSRLLDWTDRTTCVLFGDGAGAIVLEAAESDGDADFARRHLQQAALGRAPPRQALCRRRPLDDRRRSAICAWRAGRSSSTRSAWSPMSIKACFDDAGVGAGRHRLVRAASGQPAHHRRLRRQARHGAREGGRHRRSARQHLGRLDPAGARRRGAATGASRRATSS